MVAAAQVLLLDEMLLIITGGEGVWKSMLISQLELAACSCILSHPEQLPVTSVVSCSEAHPHCYTGQCQFHPHV